MLKRIFQNRLAVNWLFLSSSSIITIIIQFGIVILITKILSPSEYGQYSLILATASIIVGLMGFGTKTIIIRTIAQNEKSGYGNFFFKVLFFRLIVFLIVLLGTIMYLSMEGILKDNLSLIFVALVYVIGMTLWEFCEAFAFGNKITKYSSILNVVFVFSWLVSIFLGHVFFTSVLSFATIIALVFMSKSLFYAILLWKKGLFTNASEFENDATSMETINNIFRQSAPYFWLVLISISFSNLPILMLGKNSGLDEVGFFSVGKQFVIPITVFIATAMQAIFPFMVSLAHSKKEEFNEKVSEGLFFMSFNSVIIFFFASLLGPLLISILFGDQYHNSIEAFKYLIWGGIIIGFDAFIANVLSATNNQKVLAKLATSDIFIGIPILYYSSYYGAEGMALGTIIFYSITYSYHWIVLVKIVHLKINKLNLIYLFSFILFTIWISTTKYIGNDFYKLMLFIIMLILLILMRNSPLKKYFFVTKLLENSSLKINNLGS